MRKKYLDIKTIITSWNLTFIDRTDTHWRMRMHTHPETHKGTYVSSYYKRYIYVGLKTSINWLKDYFFFLRFCYDN